MNINIEKGFNEAFKNKYWKHYMCLYTAIIYLPVLLWELAYFLHLDMLKFALPTFTNLCRFLLFIPMGFIVYSVYLSLNNIDQKNLSIKECFAKSFNVSAYLFALNFLYAIFMCFVLIAFVGYFVANDYITISDLQSPFFLFQNEVTAPLFTILFILFLFTLILIPYFSVAYAENLNLLDAFNWVKIFKRLCESFKSFLFSVFCSLLITLFIFLSMIFLYFSTSFWLYFCLKSMLSFSIVINKIAFNAIIILGCSVIVIVSSILMFLGNLIIYHLMAQVYKKR